MHFVIHDVVYYEMWISLRKKGTHLIESYEVKGYLVKKPNSIHY